MTRLAIPILALALGAAAAVGLVSCGGDEEGLLPGDNAEQIVDNLNSVEQAAANGECDAAADGAEEVRSQIDDLGDEVNTQLKQRLSDGAERLVSVISTSCEEAVTTTTEPTTDETTTETTTTDETESTTTTTTTEPTTTTAPTTTTVPPTTVPTTGEGGGVTPPAPEDG